ncbi:hypothetical protein CEXT_786241 [Caerostris extrusa]|uniref:Uncharacterized protein n=1 Tax=Caerostris extrusa TaxID=172846 RepID=A0AAV4MIV5_CAEEX|nr:hypothetical protein CEXT_786241 [Caerostris extrusa]
MTPKRPQIDFIITPLAIAEAEAQLPFRAQPLRILAALLLLLRKTFPLLPPMSVLALSSASAAPSFLSFAPLPIATLAWCAKEKGSDRGEHPSPTSVQQKEFWQWGILWMLVGGDWCRTRWALISGYECQKKIGKL